MIHIAIADDHKLLTDALRNMMSGWNDTRIIAQASTLAECDAMLNNQPIDILLLDIGMTDGNGLDYCSIWKEAHPQLRIVIVSYHNEASVVHRAMACGADGYVTKSATGTELREAITAISAGQTYICTDAQQSIDENPDEQEITLTTRERDVLRLIANGKTLKEIATELNLAFETVHSYSKYVKLKLGVQNTASLVRVAIEKQLI